MSSERLFRAIGDVGDDLIARADRPAQKQRAWLRWGALAACCALVIGLAALALPQMGFGAASADNAAANSTAEFSVQDTTAAENAKSAPTDANEAAAEETAVTEDAAPAAIEPQSETDEMESMYEAPAEDAVAPDVAPAGAAQGALPLLTRDCAKIALRYDGQSVIVTDADEVDEIMQALRALPLTREDAEGDTDGQILQLYLYGADAQAYYAFVELPLMRVVGADELEGGGETAMDYRSEAAKALYDALVARYFDE